jgi:hypothetical protein
VKKGYTSGNLHFVEKRLHFWESAIHKKSEDSLPARIIGHRENRGSLVRELPCTWKTNKHKPLVSKRKEQKYHRNNSLPCTLATTPRRHPNNVSHQSFSENT